MKKRKKKESFLKPDLGWTELCTLLDLSPVFEVRWTFLLISKLLRWKLFCSPPNYHFSKASASRRRLISCLFLKDGFDEIKGPQNVMERERTKPWRFSLRRNEDQNSFGECHRFALFIFLFFHKIKAPARTQICNLYCILLAFSLKGYFLKLFSLFLIG